MNDNISHFGVVQGGKAADSEEDSIPSLPYVLEDIDNNQFFGEGFLIFTSQHVAIMKETTKGAVPAMVVPLNRLKVAELVEDDEQVVGG